MKTTKAHQTDRTTRTERICIGSESDNGLSRLQFDRAVSELSALITSDVVAEYGEELTTEFLHDLLTGGADTLQRITDKCNESLSALQFPAERRQKEILYTDLLKSFAELCRQARKKVEDFGFVPIDAYRVQGGSVEYDRAVVDALFAEQSKIYIDTPQQIEVWEATQKAFAALQHLDKLAQRYGMYAINENNYRAIIEVNIEMSPTMGILGGVRTLCIRPFAVQQAHDGGLFATK